MISNRYQYDSIETLKLTAVQLEMKAQIETKIASGHYQFEKTNCAVCEGDDFIQLTEKDRYGLYCPNVVCKDCGLVMINPRMIVSSYNEFYNLEYRSLYSGFNSNAAKFFEGQLVRGKRLFNYLYKKRLFSNSDSTPFLLEVGCGAGGILNYFRSNGFMVKGIDLGAEYLQYGKEQHGLDLELGTLRDIEITKIPDVIIYSHVLEHVLDLNQELILLRAISGENTLIYVEVPGIKNIASGYRNDPLRYFQNAHTYSFSLTSLRNLFTKHNFEMLHGSEFVKAVFKPGESKAKDFQNDYQNIIKLLRTAEAVRKYYFISLAKLKVVINALVDRLKQ